MTVSRYWHTLRPLRGSQLWGRLWFRAYRPKPDTRPAPGVRSAAGDWQQLPWRTPSLLGPTTVRFLEVVGEIRSAQDWQAEHHGKLWLYHLHYFDDLAARNFQDRSTWHVALIARWIAENPPGCGVGWEPYPTSLRLANWIKWAASRGREHLSAEAVESLAVQARWLRRRLEVHLLGNHLWANAKALTMVGLFFDGAEAAQWRSAGLQLLERELTEQVLPDGGHFERSPMYHATVLEDLLDLIQLDRVYAGSLPEPLVARWREVAGRMVRWLRIMSHPDGQIAFFNDATFGVAATVAHLEHYAATLGVPVSPQPFRAVESLPDSGYVRLSSARACVVCDVGSPGPAYQPGHAHAGTLSFELSVDGARVIVNSGTSTYAPGIERLQQRSTAAHSTVEVDGENSSDVWGAFRVGRRARIVHLNTGETDGRAWVEAAHDGYHPRVHRRRWSLDHAGLVVADTLAGSVDRAVARVILHPAAVETLEARLQVAWEGAASVARVPATFHPAFGQSQSTIAMEAVLTRSPLEFRVSWR